MVNINNAGAQCFESHSSGRIQEEKKTPNMTPQLSTTVGKYDRFVLQGHVQSVGIKVENEAALPGLYE